MKPLPALPWTLGLCAASCALLMAANVQAQSARENTRDITPAQSRVTSTVASLGQGALLASSSASDQSPSGGAEGADPTFVASSMAAPALAVIQPAARSAGSAGPKSWVLLLMGAFLIFAVSQRRAQSMLDL